MGAMTDEVLVALLREYAAGRAEQKRLRRTARDLPRCRSVEAGTGPRVRGTLRVGGRRGSRVRPLRGLPSGVGGLSLAEG